MNNLSQNQLVARNVLPYRLPKRNRKTPVTILIGIICKDAIVLASDSQTTAGGLKRTDAEKITTVTFRDKEVLVSQAGNAGNSARVIEILQNMASEKEISDYRTPAELARTAMIQVKQELRKQFCNCDMAELQDLIWKQELQSELMLAYYFQNKPYLFKIDLLVGRADKENSWYAAIGCGANLGSYLLTEYTKPEMKSSLAAVIAEYIVEQVCKHDAYCSPPARVGLICNEMLDMVKARGPLPEYVHPSAIGTGVTILYTSQGLTPAARAVEKIMQSGREQRDKRIEQLITREASKTSKEFNKFLSNPTPKGFVKMKKLFGGLSHFGHFPSNPKSDEK